MKLAIQISERNGNLFQARCPSLPGCVVYAHSQIEAKARIKDAINGYLASLDVALPRELARLAFVKDSTVETPVLVA